MVVLGRAGTQGLRECTVFLEKVFRKYYFLSNFVH